MAFKAVQCSVGRIIYIYKMRISTIFSGLQPDQPFRISRATKSVYQRIRTPIKKVHGSTDSEALKSWGDRSRKSVGFQQFPIRGKLQNRIGESSAVLLPWMDKRRKNSRTRLKLKKIKISSSHMGSWSSFVSCHIRHQFLIFSISRLRGKDMSILPATG